jgi:hypothetical protein
VGFKHGAVSIKDGKWTCTPTYQTWKHMRQRCLNPNDDNYPHYGGRGITIDEHWNTFTNFLKDMGERPLGKTLDRKDVNGPYSKANCEWATVSQQNKNRRKWSRNVTDSSRNIPAYA